MQMPVRRQGRKRLNFEAVRCISSTFDPTSRVSSSDCLQLHMLLDVLPAAKKNVLRVSPKHDLILCQENAPDERRRLQFLQKLVCGGAQERPHVQFARSPNPNMNKLSFARSPNLKMTKSSIFTS
ncbi:hypothetical protein BRADI_1g54496v3 [Brachypodium distachyon]|uniref:Uncharacterized protein n=1 Tax=Brachypodium distachyon TaxID=15368 RepID=A0A0Q3HC12_BRADI|nr:hypothetical protein BRADI_1g54496v3 [Brachypodium distachyon]